MKGSPHEKPDHGPVDVSSSGVPLPSICAVCGESMPFIGPEGGCPQCMFATGSEAPSEGDTADETLPTMAGPAPTSPGSPPPRFGHFEIARHADGSLHELGRGAMGLSYLARDTALDCPVALKVIDARLSTLPAARARFLREARAAAQLRHPNVATVFHYGEEDGQCFYAMEFVEGETLEMRVRRDGPLSPAFALDVAAQVASALVAADARGVVHRDLKPSNLMLSANDGVAGTITETAMVKVIDFGLAKAVAAAAVGEGKRAADLTNGGFVGTPAFASPEQFAAPQGERDADESRSGVDTRSDIYSLGVTLWYLLTGKVPFVGRTLTEIHDRQIHGPLPLDYLTAVQVPAPIVGLLRRMLAADPAERPQTPRDLSDQLRRCREQIAPQVGGAAARRGRIVVVAGFAALLIGVVVLAAWFATRRDWTAPITTPAATGSASNAVTAVGKSVAVLPFDNRSADKDDAFFAEGMQDEILINLARVADLKVISRASSMLYRDSAKRNIAEIAKALGVSHVVEGSVQRAGDKIRVTAQLVDARTDRQQWAEHYDGNLQDVFAIQSEIAQAIVGQLQARLSSLEKAAIQERPTADLAAYDLYLRAKEDLNETQDGAAGKNNLLQSVRLLDEAVARDPKFLLALCLLARAHDDIYWVNIDHTPARLALAEAAIEHAAQLRPDAGEVHLAKAIHRYHGYEDYEGALGELELARRTLPNNSDIYLFRGSIIKRQGRWEESARDYEKGIELSPRSVYLLEQFLHSNHALRRYGDAARTLDQLVLLSPDNARFRADRVMVDIDARADLRAAAVAIPTLLDESPEIAASIYFEAFKFALYARDPVLGVRAIAAEPDPDFDNSYDAGWFAKMRNDEPGAQVAFNRANDIIRKILVKEPDSPDLLAASGYVNAALGHRAEAIAAGERAVQLLPVTKNAKRGTEILEFLATTYATAGENEKAIDTLVKLVDLPLGPSYGNLRLSPFWDSLRGDSRFEALVNRLAPVDLRHPVPPGMPPSSSPARK